MLYGSNNKKLKYVLLFSACVFVVVGFGIFFPKVAHADIKGFLTEVLGNVLYFIAELLGRLLVAVIQIFVGVVKYNDFGNAAAVAKGWVIVRDVCNMFFIAVLLMMAFGTIFQWEVYRYNRLLGRFILMAFLINFSKFIALFLIDISQVLMMTFVNAFAGIAAGNLVNAFGLQEMFQMMDSGAQDVKLTGIVGALMLAIILLTIAIIVMVVLAIVLLMRIIVLWILIILSPFAFLARTWPGSGERVSAQWWAAFGKYLTVGPIIAFFLWLSLTIMTTTGGTTLAESQLNYNSSNLEQEQIIEFERESVIEEFGVEQSGKFYAAISKISSSDQLLSYIIAISLLVGSLMVANKMGVMGGQFAGQVQAKIGSGLAKAAKLGAAGVAFGAGGAALIAARKPLWKATKGITGYGERKLFSKKGVGLDPRRLIRGVKEDFAERKRNAEISGSNLAGARLQRGGFKGVVGGFLGASRDASKAYLAGPLATKGIGRAFRVMRGGPKAMEKLNDEIKEEESKVEENKNKAGNSWTGRERDDMQNEKGKKDGFISGTNKFISGAGNSVDLSGMGREMKLHLGQMIVGELKTIEKLLNTKKGEMSSANPRDRNKIQSEIDGLSTQKQSLELKYKPLKDVDNKISRIRQQMALARQNGDEVKEKKLEGEMNSHEDDFIKTLGAEINIDSGWHFKEDWRGKLKEQNEKMQAEVKDLEVKLGQPEVTEEQKKEAQDQVKESQDKLKNLKERQVSIIPPQAFHALREYRLLLREEANKLDTTNDDELVYMHKDAVKNDDKIRAGAVLIQAARARHLNEIVNASQYTRDRNVTEEEKQEGWEFKKAGTDFASDQQGLSDFFEQTMIEKLGMDKQEALSLQNDVSNIVETAHQWTMGQSVGVKNGQYISRSPHEQGMRAAVEMAKQDPENINRRAGRLGLGGESIDPETGERVHTVGTMGLTHILHNWKAIINGDTFDRNRYNKSAAQHLSTDRNMKILHELGSLLDNKEKKEYKKLDGKFTEREAFFQFLIELKKYAVKTASDVKSEAEEINEVLKKGLSNLG